MKEKSNSPRPCTGMNKKPNKRPETADQKQGPAPSSPDETADIDDRTIVLKSEPDGTEAAKILTDLRVHLEGYLYGNSKFGELGADLDSIIDDTLDKLVGAVRTKEIKNVEAFATTICRNTAEDHRRKRTGRAKHKDGQPKKRDLRPIENVPPQDLAGEDQRAYQRILIRQALGVLDQADAARFLRYLEGDKDDREKMWRELGGSNAQIRQWYSRTRKRLTEILESPTGFTTKRQRPTRKETDE